MSIKYSKSTRRQFLIGGGQALLLPLLPSLLPEFALAQSVTKNRMMCFVLSHHGEYAYWPARTLATTAVGSIGVRERLLSSLGNNAGTAVSSLMNNSLYNSLLTNNQITIARGVDVHISEGNGHVTRALGGHTVNEFGSTSTNPNHRSTFDYIIEKSLSVYPSSTSAQMTKAIRVDLQGGWTFVQRDGERSINPNPFANSYQNDIVTMYNAVFGSLTGGTTNPSDLTNQRKTNILNRVFPAFQSYRNNRKISSDDRVRLDQHIAYLSDLQNSFANVAPALTCQKPAQPNPNGNLEVTRLYIDLLATAFRCGLTQFGALQFEFQDPTWIPGYTGGAGFHGVMHGDRGLAAQHNAYESYQRFAYNVIADRFLAPLNVEEGSTGRTYVDNMITTTLSHLGMQGPNETGNHLDNDLQHVMIGSMGGKLRAGRFYALPNQNNRHLPHNAFIMTLLNLMGVPPSEYTQNSSVAGQGFGYYPSGTSPFGARIYTPITEMLA